jgi:aspartate carbamoyltransferase regulatory subunit
MFKKIVSFNGYFLSSETLKTIGFPNPEKPLNIVRHQTFIFY